MVERRERGLLVRRWTPAVLLAVVTTTAAMVRADQPASPSAAPASPPSSSSSSSAQASDAETQKELLEEVRQLRAEVEKLKAERSATAPAAAATTSPSAAPLPVVVTAPAAPAVPAVSAEQIAATAAAVQADADKHTQMFDMTNPFMGGYDGKNFVIKDEKGDFVFHPWLQIQVRNTTTWREDGKNFGTEDDTQNGFEIRRLKFGFDGNMFGTDLTYAVQFAANRNASTTTVKTGSTTQTVNQGNGGVPVLEEAWAHYEVHDTPFGFQVGEFKDPLVRESLMSSKKFQEVERTLLTDTFTGGDNYIEGAMLTWGIGNDPIHAAAALTNGINSRNTNYENFPSPPGAGADFGTAARVEWLAFGNYSDYDSFSAFNLKKNMLVFGAAGDYTQYGSASQTLTTADAQLKLMPGWSLFGAIEDRYIAGGNSSPDYNEYGLIGQLGYMITPKLEAFGRGSYIHFNANDPTIPAGSNLNVDELAIGMNYFFHGPASKFSMDLTYLPNGSPIADTGAGILTNQENELVLRIQYQLLI